MGATVCVEALLEVALELAPLSERRNCGVMGINEGKQVATEPGAEPHHGITGEYKWGAAWAPPGLGAATWPAAADGGHWSKRPIPADRRWPG